MIKNLNSKKLDILEVTNTEEQKKYTNVRIAVIVVTNKNVAQKQKIIEV